MKSALFALVVMAIALSAAMISVSLPGVGAAHADTLVDQRNQAARETARPAPNLWTRAVVYVRVQQQKFYRQLSAAVKKIKTERTLEAAWGLVVLSFLYGVFHAAGPGHGKAVISAYLLANERQVRRGITLAVLSSLMQAVTAVALVTVFILILSATGRATQRSVGYLESASYALICAVGLYMMWRVVAPLFARLGSRTSDVRQPHDHEHSHSHGHDHGHSHDHDSSCGHKHIPTPQEIGETKSLWQAAPIILSVGIRPCSGAVIVLIFANAIGIYLVGVGATVAMSIGTAITVSSLAVLTLVSKNFATRLIGQRFPWIATAYQVLGFMAAVLIFLIGAVLFAGSLGPDQPFI